MANFLTLKTVIIDTAMPNRFTVSQPLPGPYRLTRIYWFNPAAIGDLCTITDGYGNIVTALRCEVANQSQVFYDVPEADTIQDFQVTEIDSGILYVTVKQCAA
jgi:hypothetical protein